MSEFSTKTIIKPQTGIGAVRVVVVAGKARGASIEGRKVTVGRSRVADLTLGDPTVSEFHVEVSAHPEGIELRDLGSYNGTYYEGARVLHAVVARGSTVQLGESAMRVDASVDQAVPSTQDSFRDLIGRSPAMRELFGLLAKLAPTELAVFVEGPTGSGKELVARALHDESARAGRPFVVLDCAALPASLAESVLFGHAAGAFTGATETRTGIFESANGGTIFLDEIGELPLDLQPKLLRVLEKSEVMRVGEVRPRPISVRVVSATWRDLRRMVNQGMFRDDLYFRLAQTRVKLPALSERREDIELLAASFLRRLPRNAAVARSLSREALSELAQRDFPGNVRELKNVIERAAYMAEGPVIRPHDLAFERLLQRSAHAVETAAPDAEGEVLEFKGAKRTAVDDFERDYLMRLMTKTGGNLTTAASLAGIERHYLRTLLKKHGLHARD
ncbi:MAG: sigma 54-interacting transcriptional regulator [Labilithrix sp.]|nr:sigma 54-interacting transcriptional regulator [Labilithrix sp.]MCW5816935.1 sigma 54-interacting transcriptional regulator [Labilithrix sp.]